MDYGFKFKLGDIVAAAGSCTESRTEAFCPDETRYLVAERQLRECHGGVQRFYICRAIGARGGVSKDYYTLSEIEIVASEPFVRVSRRKHVEELAAELKDAAGQA